MVREYGSTETIVFSRAVELLVSSGLVTRPIVPEDKPKRAQSGPAAKGDGHYGGVTMLLIAAAVIAAVYLMVG